MAWLAQPNGVTREPDQDGIFFAWSLLGRTASGGSDFAVSAQGRRPGKASPARVRTSLTLLLYGFCFAPGSSRQAKPN